MTRETKKFGESSSNRPPATEMDGEATDSSARGNSGGERSLRGRQLELLSAVVRSANSSLDPDKISSFIMNCVRDLVDAEAWSLLLIDESGEYLTFKAAEGPEPDVLKDMQLRMGQGVAGAVARDGLPMIVDDAVDCPLFDQSIDHETGFETRSILALPLKCRDRIIGVVEILNKREGSFTSLDKDDAMLLLEPAGIALENARLFARTERLTLLDDLTQLYNTRYLYRVLAGEIERAKRHKRNLAVIFLDLDGFKQVNDVHGHLIGSRTLQVVADILREHTRSVDILVRYGGDEYTLVLPDTDLKGASVVADRLRKAIRDHDYSLELAVKIHISASFGISSYPEHGDSAELLIQRADQAMYSVKQNSKDGVAVSDHP
jgi:diguanylate cyclase (GGDEF)-like protein